jgi:hypothetical protein
MALAAAGSPTRLLTLTVNPSHGADPTERRRQLAAAWKLCVKRLRREHGAKAIAYLAITEQTKRGEPHLHILLRSPYIPHAKLSAMMAEFIDAPIVDIRRIRGERHVIRYVAKYLTKDPLQFGSCKRYFRSANYDTSDYSATLDTVDESTPWVVFRNDLTTIVIAWRREGLQIERVRDDYIIGIDDFPLTPSPFRSY